MIPTRTAFAPSLATLATAFADQTPEEPTLEIPEDLTTLSDEDLATLSGEAMTFFQNLYGDGTNKLTDEDLNVLGLLTSGIETLNAEAGRRETLAAERSAKAQELAAKIGAFSSEPEVDDEGDGGEEFADEAPEAAAQVADAVVAAGQRRGRATTAIPMGANRAQRRAAVQGLTAAAKRSIREVSFATDAPGYAVNQPMDFLDMAKAVDKRLGGFNKSLYAAASQRGQHIREQGGIAVLRKPFEKQAIVASADPQHIEDVFAFATDQKRLPGQSLVAAGGWCAPSEILYDFYDEGVSSDGLISLPEIQIARGGIQYTRGISWADLYANTGFCFTEQNDIDGEYAPGANPGDPNVAGDKPCYHIECPTFEECRLDVCGLCITAGLLQQRGYPEILAATIQGALLAHDHKMSARIIQALVADSTPVVMPSSQVGATAPLLTSIELQVEHYRYATRLARGTTLEAVFPYWVHGVVRSDLSRRLGVDLLNVTNAQIDAWFSARGINPQFVYDWQPLDGAAAGAFTAWPTTVQFLLYRAGTWVRGSSDVITLDTIYDSVNLAQNEFTALFTEEGWLVCKRGTDSRVITVPITADGATHAGVDIAHNGTLVAGA